VSALHPRGTCFGWEIRSPTEFAYLRGGGGEPLTIEVASGEAPAGERRLLVEYLSTPESPINARLYGDDSTFRLFVAGAGGGWFSIDTRTPRIEIPPSDDPIRREERLWGIPAALCFLARGDLPLHAAAVELDGAILLAAPSGFGKTMLSAFMVASGLRLLGEDLSCIRLGPEPSVVPGPAMLRLRRGLAEQLELSHTHELGTRDDRVHLALDGALRGDCRPVAIRAVVLLHEDDEGVSLERVPRAAAVQDLWSLSFRIPRDTDRERCFRGVAELAESIPIWSLRYPRRLDALAQAAERVLTGV
jgi:hypothetical protein